MEEEAGCGPRDPLDVEPMAVELLPQNEALQSTFPATFPAEGKVMMRWSSKVREDHGTYPGKVEFFARYDEDKVVWLPTSEPPADKRVSTQVAEPPADERVSTQVASDEALAPENVWTEDMESNECEISFCELVTTGLSFTEQNAAATEAVEPEIVFTEAEPTENEASKQVVEVAPAEVFPTSKQFQKMRTMDLMEQFGLWTRKKDERPREAFARCRREVGADLGIERASSITQENFKTEAIKKLLERHNVPSNLEFHEQCGLIWAGQQQCKSQQAAVAPADEASEHKHKAQNTVAPVDEACKHKNMAEVKWDMVELMVLLHLFTKPSSGPNRQFFQKCKGDVSALLDIPYYSHMKTYVFNAEVMKRMRELYKVSDENMSLHDQVTLIAKRRQKYPVPDSWSWKAKKRTVHSLMKSDEGEDQLMKSDEGKDQQHKRQRTDNGV